MTQDDLIAAHHYIEKLLVDETTKETCRGIMLGRYWAVTFKNRGLDITDIPTRDLIDMVANANIPPARPNKEA